MSVIYGAMGVVGYWSRGSAITSIVIFSLGDSPRIRVASAFILVQVGSPGVLPLLSSTLPPLLPWLFFPAFSCARA